MRIALSDTRNLAVAGADPAGRRQVLDNYTTGGWEQPFDPKTHLRPLVPLDDITVDLRRRAIGRPG